MSETKPTAGTCKNCGEPIAFGTSSQDLRPTESRWLHAGGFRACAARSLPEGRHPEGGFLVAEPGPESHVSIHDAVRGTLDAIKAQRGGSLPDGLEIRHTSSTPYTVGLWCQQCDGYVRQRTTLEPEFGHIMTMVAVYAYYHACWRPKPAEGAGTEGTETPKVSGGGTITLEWKTDPETTARWAEWLAAGLGKPMRADAGPFSPLDYNIGFTPSSDRVWLTCNREQCEGIPPFGRTESGANFRALVEAAKLHHAACHGGRS